MIDVSQDPTGSLPGDKRIFRTDGHQPYPGFWDENKVLKMRQYK